MDGSGYPMIWLTIINSSASDASSWASTYGLDPDHVLFDDAGWSSQGISTGTPTIYMMHTSNMLIWDRVEGWYNPADFDEVFAWYPDSYIPWASTQSGAID